MCRDIPHGELTVPGPGKPPSFYVTESDRLPLIPCNFGDYELSIRRADA
jgi:hypothetical protein